MAECKALTGSAVKGLTVPTMKERPTVRLLSRVLAVQINGAFRQKTFRLSKKREWKKTHTQITARAETINLGPPTFRSFCLLDSCSRADSTGRRSAIGKVPVALPSVIESA